LLSISDKSVYLLFVFDLLSLVIVQLELSRLAQEHWPFSLGYLWSSGEDWHCCL